MPNEYDLKAVFLYTFGRYVEWPTAALGEAPAPFVIGVVGEDSFAGALDTIAKRKMIQGRRIVIQRFPSPKEYRQPCHMIFVSRSLTAEQRAELIAKTQKESVFVVGEVPGFAEQGAMVNFIVEGDRVRFEINVDAARRAQLRMDAKLLSLGIRVGNPRTAATN
ncbi:MAG: YfiR family protein [Planctomycetaceae bacterium]|nr:YfiR family protein [Planctomycetaceae bacterium]